jgi:hypothetical protein
MVHDLLVLVILSLVRAVGQATPDQHRLGGTDHAGLGPVIGGWHSAGHVPSPPRRWPES